MRTRTTSKIIVASIATAALVLGCGGPAQPVEQGQAAETPGGHQPIAPVETGNEVDPGTVINEVSGAVFDFSNMTEGPANPITIEIPADLQEAMGSKADDLLLERATLTPYELDGAAKCAVKMEFEWAPGADERIASAGSSQDGPNYGFAAGYGGWRPLSQLTPDGEGGGNFFIADDNSHAVRVSKCATNPMDTKNAWGLSFKVLRDGDIRDFADVEYTIMKDGSITIVDSEVRGFARDSNGTWVGQ